jgi:hypothetical protein
MLRHADNAIAFRHELARLAIEELINPHRRIALHQQALGVLEGLPDARVDPASSPRRSARKRSRSRPS